MLVATNNNFCKYVFFSPEIIQRAMKIISIHKYRINNRLTLFLSVMIVAVIVTGIFYSCKKEKSCEGCIGNNKPPIAIAGPDQVITLPTDSVLLDGSASNDPDGTISEWLWKKISGPASFNIVNTTTAKTIVR